MKLGTKYMARSTVKKLQLTSLDVNQISFKIYDTTWKSLLHKHASPFGVLGSNQSNLFKQSKKSSSIQQLRRETAVFVTASTLTCLGNFNLTLSKAKIVSLCIYLETFQSLWRRFWTLLLHSLISCRIWAGSLAFCDLNQQRVLIKWLKVLLIDVAANIIVRITDQC